MSPRGSSPVSSTSCALRSSLATAQVNGLSLRGSTTQPSQAIARASPGSSHPSAKPAQEWVECGSGWQDPFTPTAGQDWQQFPALGDLMPWSTTGMTPNRDWFHAPDAATLQERWSRLILAAPEDKARYLKETDTRGTSTTPDPLPGGRASQQPLSKETSTIAEIERVALRSFDRQYVIYDSRVIDRPRTELWQVRGHRQVYVTEQHAHPIEHGPGLIFTRFVPGVHHFNGLGGRVLPLYRDPETLAANLAPGLTDLIAARLKTTVPADDMLAYIAALTSHPLVHKPIRQRAQNPGDSGATDCKSRPVG